MATISIVVLALSSVIAAYYLFVTVRAAITNKREIYDRWFKQIAIPKLKDDILELSSKLKKEDLKYIPSTEYVLELGVFGFLKLLFVSKKRREIVYPIWKNHFGRVFGAFAKTVLFPFGEKVITIATEFAANARLVFLDISFGSSISSSNLSSVFAVLEGFKVHDFNNLSIDDINEIKSQISRKALAKHLFDTVNPEHTVNEIIFNYGNMANAGYDFGDLTAQFCKVLVEKGHADKIKYLENGFKLVVYKKIIRALAAENNFDIRTAKMLEFKRQMLSKEGENIALVGDGLFETNIVNYLFNGPGVDNMYFVQNISKDDTSPINVVLATDNAIAVEKSKLLLLMMQEPQKNELFRYISKTEQYLKFKETLTSAIELFDVEDNSLEQLKMCLDYNIDKKRAKQYMELLSSLINAKEKFDCFREIEIQEATSSLIFTEKNYKKITKIFNRYKTNNLLPSDMMSEYSKCDANYKEVNCMEKMIFQKNVIKALNSKAKYPKRLKLPFLSKEKKNCYNGKLR